MNLVKYYIALTIILLLSSCHKGSTAKNNDKIHFATSAEYPPFEYLHNGDLIGYDIELAKHIAKELHKEAVFENFQFSSILPALHFRQVDAAISTITITEERKKNVKFSDPYYFEGMAAVFKTESPVKDSSQLKGKKLSAQLGSTMEIWLRAHAAQEQLMIMDNNNLAIEALKAGHVDVVLMDGAQAAIFSQKNHGLSYAIIAKAETGYAIAFPKNSSLTTEINQALKSLKQKGLLSQLEDKWLGGAL